jgi:hypothetical protein
MQNEEVFSNSRSLLKILYDLCRKALSEPFCAPCVSFDATCTARLELRLTSQQLFASTEVELRHGQGARGQTDSQLRGGLTRIDRQGRSRFGQAVIQRFEQVSHGRQGIMLEQGSHLLPK